MERHAKPIGELQKRCKGRVAPSSDVRADLPLGQPGSLCESTQPIIVCHQALDRLGDGRRLNDTNERANRPLAGKGQPGYNYFHQYLKGMGKAPKAYRWSWHSYQEAEDTFRKLKYRNHPQEWWKPFHLFEKAVDRVMEHAKYKYPNVWLSEQGVEYNRSKEFGHYSELPAAWIHRGASVYIMRALVEHGSQQLTRQPNPILKVGSQVARFFYYSSRGAPGFDSGLLEAEKLPVSKTSKKELRHKYGVNHPRAIYGIYARKTPGR